MKQIDILLHGMGNVNRTVLSLLDRQEALLRQRHALSVRVVGAADSRGALWAAGGIAPAELLAAKRHHGTLAVHPTGEPGVGVVDLLARHSGPPLTLLEATPVNLETGGVGLRAMRAALAQGHSVVSANKGPLVLAFQSLTALARRNDCGLAYSATVCGGLPIVNMGRYDLAHATITKLEGILNSTSHYLLSEMEAGKSYEQALAEAQAVGIAETNPTLDVSGWDAANKLIILANSVLRQPTTKEDVTVTGIEGITGRELREARAQGGVLKLVARAIRQEEGYQLDVAPRVLPDDHPLARLHGHAMGAWIESDINGEIFLSIHEEDPTPTAAAMLRDLVLLARRARTW